MKFGLSENVICEINSVIEKYPQIEKALIYGSRAKGNFRNGSDIDLTIFGKDIDHDLLLKLLAELEKLLLPYYLDINIYHKISNIDLLQHIRNFGKEFYTRKSMLPKSETVQTDPTIL